MNESFHATRLIQWADTDAAGIAHFTAFFRYMEEVEHEFLRSRGLSVDSRGGPSGKKLSWPRVSVRCDYHAPVKFEDRLDIELTLARVGEKSITYEFAFTHQSRQVAAGSITAVCCEIRPGHPPAAVVIPAEFLEKVQGPAVEPPRS